MARSIGKRRLKNKPLITSSEDFSRGDFSKPLTFTQNGMESKNSAQEKAIVKGMERLLGPVPKGKSLGT